MTSQPASPHSRAPRASARSPIHSPVGGSPGAPPAAAGGPAGLPTGGGLSTRGLSTRGLSTGGLPTGRSPARPPGASPGGLPGGSPGASPVGSPAERGQTTAKSEVTFAEELDAAAAQSESEPLKPKSRDGMSTKVNVASKRYFIKVSYPTTPEFTDAILLPALQFNDRNLESSFYTTHYTSMRRISYTVFVGWFLNCLQLWFGLYKGWIGLKASRHSLSSSSSSSSSSSTPAPAALFSAPPAPQQRADIFRERGQSLLDWALLRSLGIGRRRLGGVGGAPPSWKLDVDWAAPPTPPPPRCLWGKEEVSFPLRPDATLFEAACINQTVADSIILFFWWLFSSLRKYHRRIEAISIGTQITRVLLIVLFAQGMWSDCARNQGPTDIMMNNIAIASANVTYFNCVPICRVRRGCVVTGIFAVGVLEIIIVMTQGTTGGAAMSPNDAAQLTMYIIIFVFTPVVALLCRYRSEVSERQAYFMTVLHAKMSAVNARLQAEVDDLNKVRDMDIERSLPEGLLPSKIVHVAVRELQQADRCAEQLQKALPAIFYQQRERRSYAASEGADKRMAASRRMGKTMELTAELKANIISALRLLSRSHDIYRPAVNGMYAGALMFHAIGHAVEPTTCGGESQDAGSTLDDQPLSLLSRNTARRCEPGAGGSGGGGGRQLSQTVFGESYNEYAVGDSSCACSPRLASEEFAAGDLAAHVFGDADFPFLSGLGEMARNIGSNFHFDMLRVTRMTKDESIITTGMLLASPIAGGIQFDWKRWYTFLRAVQQEYGSSSAIPYHNRTHSSIHAHTCAVLLDWLQHASYSTKLESLGVLVASICHDVGHPGRTNAYLVNANKRLAIIYNDISVLENYHACRTFEILMQKPNNFINTIGLDDYRFVRKVIIELILATDMRAHFELINNYKLARNTPAFNIWAAENKMSTLKLVVKAADLSHGAFDWPIHQTLSMSVNEEFWAQGDAELAMGLPISPLCDRNIPKEELAQSQAGFLEFLVLPLYKELSAVDTTGLIASACETRIRSNIERWKNLAQPKAPAPPSS